MTRVAIGLGSNLGDRLEYMRSGLAHLRRISPVVGVSSLFETDPVGGPDQGPYLNAVAVLETDLDAESLLEELIEIEIEHGRVRNEKWGPRTLDLDIIAHRGDPVETATVQIPHPRASRRRFVLEPLIEVWPTAPVGDGTTAEAAIQEVPSGGVFRFIGDWEVRPPSIGALGPILVMAQLVLIGAVAVTAFLLLERPLTPIRSGIGVAVAAFGSALVIGAVIVLGSNLSALPEPRSGAAMVVRGPFRLVRHPIYGGVILGSLAMTVLAGSVWPAVPLGALVLVLYRKSLLEERALTLMFPGYFEYRERVRRRFLPFLF